MKAKLKELIQSDARRGYVKCGLGKSLQHKYITTWRKASHYKKTNPLGILYRLRLNSLSVKSGIQIPTETKIGKGFFIAHFGSIIINPAVVIGDNVNIAPGVVIGKANRGEKKGVPIIGNKVWIGANSIIVGKISIGDDVLIAPGAYVNIDVPEHSVVIGNPGIIHHKEMATDGYINNQV